MTPWTEAYQVPLSMGFSRQEYWSGLPCPPPGDLPDPGVEPRSPALQADSLPFELPRKSNIYQINIKMPRQKKKKVNKEKEINLNKQNQETNGVPGAGQLG